MVYIYNVFKNNEKAPKQTTHKRDPHGLGGKPQDNTREILTAFYKSLRMTIGERRGHVAPHPPEEGSPFPEWEGIKTTTNPSTNQKIQTI